MVTYIAAPWDGSWLQPGYVAMSIRPLAGSPDDERKYPCDRCGKLRTKAEGGTTFTVCDECWNETMGGSPDDGDVLSRSEYLRTLERLAAHAEHPNMILAPLRAARAHDARLRQRLRDAEPSVLQNDVRDLLEAVGLEDYARTVSPHRVVQDEVIPAIRRLREALRRVAYDGYIAPSPAEIARRAYEGERR